MQLRTLRSGKHLRIAGIVLVLVQPIFTVLHYTWNEYIHPYPPDADTLAIPVFTEFIAWIVFAPILILLILRATQKYPGSVPLFIMNKQRRTWSIGVSIIFGLLILQVLVFLVDVMQYYNVPLLINVVLGTILLLNLRAAFVAKA
jgi:hypothetical protein